MHGQPLQNYSAAVPVIAMISILDIFSLAICRAGLAGETQVL